MKREHNLNQIRKRGIAAATEECLLSALALNLKRAVKALSFLFFIAFSCGNQFFMPLLILCQQVQYWTVPTLLLLIILLPHSCRLVGYTKSAGAYVWHHDSFLAVQEGLYQLAEEENLTQITVYQNENEPEEHQIYVTKLNEKERKLLPQLLDEELLQALGVVFSIKEMSSVSLDAEADLPAGYLDQFQPDPDSELSEYDQWYAYQNASVNEKTGNYAIDFSYYSMWKGIGYVHGLKRPTGFDYYYDIHAIPLGGGWYIYSTSYHPDRPG